MKKMYYNKEYRKAFKKSDCPEDLGSEETFIVHEAEFCSDISRMMQIGKRKSLRRKKVHCMLIK